MATINAKTYFVPQIVEYVNNIKKKVDETENNAFADMQKQMTEQMANALCSFMFKTAAENKAVDDALSYEWKNAGTCLEYVINKAKELSPKGTQMLWVPDDKVFGWMTEYYLRDDKAEWEEKKAEEAKKKAEAEERAKKNAEKAQKKAEAEAKKSLGNYLLIETIKRFLICGQTVSQDKLTKAGCQSYIGQNLTGSDIALEVAKKLARAIDEKKFNKTELLGKFKLQKETVEQLTDAYKTEQGILAREALKAAEIDDSSDFDDSDDFADSDDFVA